MPPTPASITTTTIQHPAADPAHPSHWNFITALIAGLFSSLVAPAIESKMSPKDAANLDAATQLVTQDVIPIVISFEPPDTDGSVATATITTQNAPALPAAA